MGQLKPARLAGGRGNAGSFSPASFAMPLLLIAGLAFGLSACGSGSDNGEKLGERVVPLGQPVPKGGGVYSIGKPYQIAGLWYTPREEPGYDRVGSASWYGELFHGRRTANGEIYDMDRLSAAHPTLPLPIYARVTNLNNGRSIAVRVNDRGPYARDRVIDLSRRSAELLGFRNHGTATVRVRYLGRAPLNGDDSYERRYLANQSWVQFAAKGKSSQGRDGAFAVSSTLPPENPENLARPWKQAAPQEAAPQDEAAPADPALQGWKATTKAAALPPPAAALPSPQSTGSIPSAPKPKVQGQGLVIQAGSFKNKENADRARNVLSAIAPVDVAPIAVGGDVYFRVRVGPFSDLSGAEAALAKVTKAGYQGAKMVAKN
ncbi:MAG: septal ring lytic transglycosylase RlpA family protein [Methyloceanibacter sp.]